jgi:hypothetical protein
MKRYPVYLLILVAILATFWAYTIADALIREFSANITLVDLGAIFVLGLIAGLALGLAMVLRRARGSDTA